MQPDSTGSRYACVWIVCCIRLVTDTQLRGLLAYNAYCCCRLVQMNMRMPVACAGYRRIWMVRIAADCIRYSSDMRAHDAAAFGYVRIVRALRMHAQVMRADMLLRWLRLPGAVAHVYVCCLLLLLVAIRRPGTVW